MISVFEEKVFTKNIYYITAHTGNNVLHYKYNNCKSTWEEVSNLEHTGFIFFEDTSPIFVDTSSVFEDTSPIFEDASSTFV